MNGWTLAYTIAILINGGLAWASGSKGLQKVALIWIGSFSVFEFIGQVYSPPLRMGLFALADLICFTLFAIVCLTHKEPMRIFKPITLFYGLTMIAHIISLSNIGANYATYGVALNALFALMLATTTIAGGRKIVEAGVFGRGLGLFSGGVHRSAKDRRA